MQAAVSQYLAARERTAEPKSDITSEITWDVAQLGSPYPGLMHFTPRYAPVFFGREAEVRELLDLLDSSEGRFVIVSGASGSGKSSLVDAGVLPRLVDGSDDRSLRRERLLPSWGVDIFRRPDDRVEARCRAGRLRPSPARS